MGMGEAVANAKVMDAALKISIDRVKSRYDKSEEIDRRLQTP